MGKSAGEEGQKPGKTDHRGREEKPPEPVETDGLLEELAGITRSILWQTDAKGFITGVSRTSGEVLGYSPEELQGRVRFHELHPEQGRSDFRNRFMKASDNGEVIRNLTSPARKRNGAELWLLTNAVPLPGSDGSPGGYRGISVDITERKKAEEALQVKSRAFDSSVSANSIADSKGLITEVNDAFLRIWGYTDRSQVLGKPVSHFLASAATSSAILESLAKDLEWQGDYEGLRRDGSRFIAHGMASALTDPTGEIVGYHSSVIDVTESRKNEKRLKESEARNLALLNALPDMMFILDSEGVFVDYHASDQDMLLIPPESFLGKKISDVVPGHIAGPTMDRIQQLKRGQGVPPLRYETQVRGGTRYYESRLVGCGHERFLSIVRDITDLCLSELEREKLHSQLRQAHKMESVGRLAGGVAHDFNNMLGIILGRAEMALEKLPSNHPAINDLREIHLGAERSADLTRQLLAFARKQPVSPRVLDLNHTFTGMLQMLRRLIGEDIELRWKPGSDLWPVRVDPTQMGQMLANLCINSRQAIPGTGTISIETENFVMTGEFCREHPGARKGDYVTLTVTDTGCGMDASTIDSIYEPFFTTRKPGYGTGLGLSTVYGIVKQSQGYIDVESSPGGGTTFRIHFPRSEAPVDPPQEEKPLPDSLPRGDETLLLVEDEMAILNMTGTMLDNLGYRVLYASRPSLAMELAEKNRDSIRLLITDVIMPEQNGRDLAWSLKRVIPELRCLFMSGYTSNIIAHHGVLDQGVHFIAKPFTSRELALSVRRMLDQE